MPHAYASLRVLTVLLVMSCAGALPAAAQWTRIDTNGLPAGANGLRVASVAANEAAVFATSGQPQALYRSVDDGGSWARVAAVPEPASGAATVLTAGQTVLVQDGAPGAALHVSVDAGATWTSRAAPPPLDVSIHTLARADTPAGRSHAFVSAQNPNRLYVTHDDFATVHEALPGLAIDQIVSNGRVLLALPTRTTSAIQYHRSDDGGRTWALVLEQPLAADAAYASRDSLFVYRLTPSGTQFMRTTIYGSQDGTTFPERGVVASGPVTTIESSPEHSAVYHSFQLSVHGGRAPQSIRAGFPQQAFGPVVVACHLDGGPGGNRALSSRFVYLMATCDETGTAVFNALYRHPVVGATVATADPPMEPDAELRVPNPVRGATTLTVRLTTPADATLTLVDAQGRQVALLTKRALPAGATAVPLSVSRLAPGVYWLRLESGGQQVVRPVTVVR